MCGVWGGRRFNIYRYIRNYLFIYRNIRKEKYVKREEREFDILLYINNVGWKIVS